MATQYTTVRVVVMVDDAGNAGVGLEEADAVTHYEDTVQPVTDAAGMRQVILNVRVPLPTPLELSGEVACEESETGLTVG